MRLLDERSESAPPERQPSDSPSISDPTAPATRSRVSAQAAPTTPPPVMTTAEALASTETALLEEANSVRPLLEEVNSARPLTSRGLFTRATARELLGRSHNSESHPRAFSSRSIHIDASSSGAGSSTTLDRSLTSTYLRAQSHRAVDEYYDEMEVEEMLVLSDDASPALAVAPHAIGTPSASPELLIQPSEPALSPDVVDIQLPAPAQLPPSEPMQVDVPQVSPLEIAPSATITSHAVPPQPILTSSEDTAARTHEARVELCPVQLTPMRVDAPQARPSEIAPSATITTRAVPPQRVLTASEDHAARMREARVRHFEQPVKQASRLPDAPRPSAQAIAPSLSEMLPPATPRLAPAQPKPVAQPLSKPKYQALVQERTMDSKPAAPMTPGLRHAPVKFGVTSWPPPTNKLALPPAPMPPVSAQPKTTQQSSNAPKPAPVAEPVPSPEFCARPALLGLTQEQMEEQEAILLSLQSSSLGEQTADQGMRPMREEVRATSTDKGEGKAKATDQSDRGQVTAMPKPAPIAEPSPSEDCAPSAPPGMTQEERDYQAVLLLSYQSSRAQNTGRDTRPVHEEVRAPNTDEGKGKAKATDGSEDWDDSAANSSASSGSSGSSTHRSQSPESPIYLAELEQAKAASLADMCAPEANAEVQENQEYPDNRCTCTICERARAEAAANAEGDKAKAEAGDKAKAEEGGHASSWVPPSASPVRLDVVPDHPTEPSTAHQDSPQPPQTPQIISSAPLGDDHETSSGSLKRKRGEVATPIQTPQIISPAPRSAPLQDVHEISPPPSKRRREEIATVHQGSAHTIIPPRTPQIISPTPRPASLQEVAAVRRLILRTPRRPRTPEIISPVLRLADMQEILNKSSGSVKRKREEVDEGPSPRRSARIAANATPTSTPSCFRVQPARGRPSVRAPSPALSHTARSASVCSTLSSVTASSDGCPSPRSPSPRPRSPSPSPRSSSLRRRADTPEPAPTRRIPTDSDGVQSLARPNAPARCPEGPIPDRVIAFWWRYEASEKGKKRLREEGEPEERSPKRARDVTPEPEERGPLLSPSPYVPRHPSPLRHSVVARSASPPIRKKKTKKNSRKNQKKN